MSAMNGKTVVVTGATDGIGKVTARELARMGATVVLVGRNPQKLAASVSEIKAHAGHDRVTGEIADLSEIAQVAALAERLKAAHPRIDVLINNAGALITTRQVTSEGLEMTFALNHMNYFVLTTALLDTLIASAPARIINVSSEAHRFSGLNWNDLQAEHGYQGFLHYGRTKLMNLLFTMELVRKLALRGIGSDQVTVNALHPGVVNSQFFKGKTSIASLSMQIMSPIMRLTGLMITPDKGAETPIYLASSPDVNGASGGYYDNRRLARPSTAAYDDADAKRLWALSEQIAVVHTPVVA